MAQVSLNRSCLFIECYRVIFFILLFDRVFFLNFSDMPRVYKRTSNRGGVSTDVFRRAAIAVDGGLSLRAAARDYNIKRTTLQRFMHARAQNADNIEMGYDNCRRRNMVFTEDMERDLASHIMKWLTSSMGCHEKSAVN
jgi:hypothetical protein